MKALVVLAVLAFGIWLWRSGRRTANKPVAPAQGREAQAIDMVACAHCGVHCALPDATEGRKGHYCSPEHRRLAEH
jgi:uncharacterized protein